MIFVGEFGSVFGSGHVFIGITLDASAAHLHSPSGLGRATSVLDEHIAKFSDAAIHGRTTDYIEQEFKEYLRDVLFVHYYDPVSINNFVYDLKNVFLEFSLNIVLAGYKITYGFKNYIDEDEIL